MNAFAETIGRNQSHRSGRRSSTDAAIGTAALRLRQVQDACYLVILFVVPLTSACLQEFGNALLVGCALLMALAWSIERILAPGTGSPSCGAELIVLGAVGLVGLQLIPLPPSLHSKLMPFASEYLTLWGTQAGSMLGDQPWATISLTPSLTRSGLVLLIGYGLFFLTLMQRLRTIEDIQRTIRLIAIGTGLMAALAILQLRGNGRFLWLFEHPFRTAAFPAKAAFSNPNHLAHFLALGIGPLFFWWYDSTQQKNGVIRGSVSATGFGLKRSTESQKRWLAGAIGLTLLAGILSFSRAGLVVLLLATLIALRSVMQHPRQLLKLLVPLTLFIGLAVWLSGTDLLQSKLEKAFQADSASELLSGRFVLWSAILDAAPSFLTAGAGLGSHAEVYPTWMEHDFGVRFSHAESGYLQILLELGVPGLVLLGLSFLLLVRWSFSTLRSSDVMTKRMSQALVGGVIVSVLHSAVDFPWYIPGCMVVTLTTCACLGRLHQLQRKNHSVDGSGNSTRRPKWPAVMAVLVILLALPIGRVSAEIALRDAETENDWNLYRRHAIAAGDAISYESMDSLDDKLDAIIMHLENCLQRDPDDYRSASLLAAMYARRFERHQLRADNRMNIREIRNTVRSTEFDSPAELAEWLHRAFGREAADLYRALAMARKAVVGQPLRGETYLLLSQLGFLTGMTPEEEDAFAAQAVRLRPHNAAIMFVTGLTLMEQGDAETALGRWRTAFSKDPGIRPMIIKALVPYLPAAEIYKRLQPGVDGLYLMFGQYRAMGQETALQEVTAMYRQEFRRTLEGDSADQVDRHFWRRSGEVFDAAGDTELAIYSLTEAVTADPGNFEFRKKLGQVLFADQQVDKARRHLEWCQTRMPDDREITNLLLQIQDEAAGEVHDEP